MKVTDCLLRCQCNRLRDVSSCLELHLKRIFFTDYNHQLIIIIISMIHNQFDTVINVLKRCLLLKITENLMLVIFKLRMDYKRKTSAPKSTNKRESVSKPRDKKSASPALRESKRKLNA